MDVLEKEEEEEHDSCVSITVFHEIKVFFFFFFLIFKKRNHHPSVLNPPLTTRWLHPYQLVAHVSVQPVSATILLVLQAAP